MRQNCFFQAFAGFGLGGEAVTYPDNIGYPMSNDEMIYVMIEMHYNNAKLDKGIVDDSGIRLYVTEPNRPIESDSAMLVAGLNANYVVLPPFQESITVSTVCNQQCTKGFPKDGIHVFNTILHTHLRGRAIKFRHIRDGVELAPIIKDDYYSFDYQDNRILKEQRLVLPGDILIAECKYSTSNDKQPVFGGFSTSEEMCLIYFDYYPKFNGLVACLGGPAVATNAKALGATLVLANMEPVDSMLSLKDVGSVSGRYGNFSNVKEYANAIKWDEFIGNASSTSAIPKSKSDYYSPKNFNLKKFQHALEAGPQHQMCMRSANMTSKLENIVIYYTPLEKFPEFVPYKEKKTCSSVGSSE